MGKATCSIPDCPDPTLARGWCRMHYWRWHRTGDPLTPPRPTALERGDAEKICTACGVAKPLGEFHIRNDRQGKPRWLSAECKACTSGRVMADAKRRDGRPAALSGPPCKRCGAPVALKPARGAGPQAVYCSRACKDKDRERQPMSREDQIRYDRARNLRRYKLTEESWAALLAAQDGKCAICRALKAGGKGGWHVDHCHESGVVRGLLCHNCNTGLGQFKDDPSLLDAAAEYVRLHASKPPT